MPRDLCGLRTVSAGRRADDPLNIFPLHFRPSRIWPSQSLFGLGPRPPSLDMCRGRCSWQDHIVLAERSRHVRWHFPTRGRCRARNAPGGNPGRWRPVAGPAIPRLAAHFFTKCRAKGRMSSFLCRSGGTSISTTRSRYTSPRESCCREPPAGDRDWSRRSPTSTFRGWVSPTRIISRSWRTRSSLSCRAGVVSPISSRKIVPFSASSNRPGRSFVAPVNAPALWPKSVLSSSVSGSAPQLTATNGPLAARR